MTKDNYEDGAAMVALAMAHQDWIRMTAEPNAALDALPDKAWERYDKWEQQHEAMQYAARAAAVWVAHRYIGHMKSYFLFEPRDALDILGHRVRNLGDYGALDTVLTGDTPHQSAHALDLVDEFVRRWEAAQRGAAPR